MLFKELGFTSQTDATGSDAYGSALATNALGNLVAVGSPHHYFDLGAVYIYRINSNGNRTLVQKIVASDSDSLRFGFSLSMSEDNSVLAIGAPFSTGYDGRVNHGAVYLYFWNGSIFSDEQKFIPDGGPSPSSGSLNNTYFGYDVSLSHSGEILAVGNNADAESGCLVYTYQKTGPTSFSSLECVANPRSDAYVSKFGRSVALSSSGTTMIVGAPDLAASNDPTFAVKPGGGFVFDLHSGSFSLFSSIYFQTTGHQFSKFGDSASISSSGETFAFGSPGFNSGKGAVALFSKMASFATPTNFQNTGKLIEPPTGVGLGFGAKISLDRYGSKALVGMYGSSDTVGKVWFFEIFPEVDPVKDHGDCGEKVWEYPAPVNQVNQRYGSAVCLSKDGVFAFVGSPLQNPTGFFWSYRNRINSRHVVLFNKPTEINLGLAASLINTSYNFIPPFSRVAQKAVPTVCYLSELDLTVEKIGSPNGSVTVSIVYGDSAGPYEDVLATFLSESFDLSSVTSYSTLTLNFGKHRIIHENDQFWIVLTCDNAYTTTADGANYLKIYGTDSAPQPFIKYDGDWQTVPNFSACYSIRSDGSTALRGDAGRLVTTPYDIRNSIYTLKAAPYYMNGGEKIIFDKNGFLKQTLTLPTPSVAGELSQEELVDFLNNNLDSRFNCTALADTVDGKPVVVLRNDDYFLNSVGYEESNSFIRIDTEPSPLTNGTLPSDNGVGFTNGAVMWAFKPDRMFDYGISPSSSYSEWHDWHENIHKPLQNFYYSNSDRYFPPPYDYRVKIALYPIGSSSELQWSLSSIYEFIVENFVMNPQTKLVTDSTGFYYNQSLSGVVDQFYINVVYSYFYDNDAEQAFLGLVWFR